MNHVIREYTEDDVSAVKQCIVELQNFHGLIDPHRLESMSIANEYLEKLLKKCSKEQGKILVVEINQTVVGMIAVMIEEEMNMYRRLKRHAIITDLFILPEYRGRGISKDLLKAAEKYAAHKGLKVIEASVLLNNGKALRSYTRNGFEEMEIILRKKIES